MPSSLRYLALPVLLLTAPLAHAQLSLLDPDEYAFRLSGGAAWAPANPGTTLGLEAGHTLGRVELAAGYIRLPDESGRTVALSAEAALLREPGFALTTFASGQWLRYAETRDRWAPTGARAVAFGLAVAHPFEVGGGGRMAPELRMFFLRTGQTGAAGVWPSEGRTGISVAVPVRNDLPGPFALLAAPTVTKVVGTPLVWGATLGLAGIGTVRPRAE